MHSIEEITDRILYDLVGGTPLDLAYSREFQIQKVNQPERVSFDTKEDLKAYIICYCNEHGWDADLLKMLDSTIEEADEIMNDYGSFPDTEVANMNRRPVEEHIPYADTPSYPVTPPSDETPPAPAQPAAQPPAAASDNAGVSTYTPQDSPAQPHQSGDDVRRYIICPKCGERICL